MNQRIKGYLKRRLAEFQRIEEKELKKKYQHCIYLDSEENPVNLLGEPVELFAPDNLIDDEMEIKYGPLRPDEKLAESIAEEFKEFKKEQYLPLLHDAALKKDGEEKRITELKGMGFQVRERETWNTRPPRVRNILDFHKLGYRNYDVLPGRDAEKFQQYVHDTLIEHLRGVKYLHSK